MRLQFLVFDDSENPQGHGSFEAIASVRQVQLAALRAEIAEVVDWAETAFAGQRAPRQPGCDTTLALLPTETGMLWRSR